MIIVGIGDLFRLLLNLQTIVLITTDIVGCDIYPFSFLCLFNEMENSSLKKVMIKAIRATDYGYDKSWLFDKGIKEELKQEVAKTDYKIKYQTQTNSQNKTEDIVIIYI